MIELSTLELLQLVATFFLIIIGTLLTLALVRVNKILKVWVEIAWYYENMKQLFIYYSMVPYVIKDKIFESIANLTQSSPQGEVKPQQNPTEK